VQEPDLELLRSIEERSNLTVVGRRLLDFDVYWASQVQHKKEQGLHREPVVAPVFITGTGRTASGFLHTLLRDSGLRVASVFEAYTIARSPHEVRGMLSGFEFLIHDIDRHIKMGDEQSPEYAMVNAHQWNDPAEDIHFDRSNFGPAWWLSHYGGIFDWAAQRMFADPVAEYEHQRACAELLGFRGGDRWCFRAPTHLMRLPQLFEVFPDATVIWLERDAAQVEPSLRKMISAMRRTRSEIVDEDEIAMLANSMTVVGPMLAEQAVADGHVPLDQIIRVSFEDLVENTAATLAGLIERLGVEVPEHLRT
jgi:hypothetical protein